MRSLSLFVALALLGGCADRWELVEFEDEGDLCFTLDGPNTAVRVDPGCVSSTCTRELAGSCEATVEAMTITLTSEVSYEENVTANECSLDCESVAVTCTVPALTDGTYAVLHGETETQLVVPGDYGCPI